MKVWAVFTHFLFTSRDGGTLYSGRWIDSEWAQKDRAQERSAELDGLFLAFHVKAHSTSIVEMSVSDIKLQDGDAQ